jgi:mycofactocin system creatininase family protein
MPDMGSSFLSSSDISEHRSIVLLPLGAWEQHGPHLPLDTDTIIINAVVAHALSGMDHPLHQFIVAPTISITASDEHSGFPGTLSTGTQALVDSVVAICRSASWARHICIVNGHGGNTDALRQISSALDYEQIHHSIWSLPNYVGADMHAGHTETSLLLHLDPQRVHLDRLQVGTTGDSRELIEAMRKDGVSAIAPNGIIGDATTATSEHGNAVLDLYMTSLQSHLTQLISE